MLYGHDIFLIWPFCKKNLMTVISLQLALIPQNEGSKVTFCVKQSPRNHQGCVIEFYIKFNMVERLALPDPFAHAKAGSTTWSSQGKN